MRRLSLLADLPPLLPLLFACGCGVLAATVSTDVPPAVLPAQELTWSWTDTPVGPMNVVVSVPTRRADQRFPVLVALHGRGEAAKGPVRGARGWIDDYWLPRALTRLAAPPLTDDDLQGLVDPARLDLLNDDLARAPYGGLIVVCPYTPDTFPADKQLANAQVYGRFLRDEVLPRVQSETPALTGPAATGIDGVSLGGRVALLVGLGAPDVFGTVGALQAAFGGDDVPGLVAEAAHARAVNPALAIRLVTSTDDYFLQTNEAIDRGLTSAGVAHRFLVLPGPHDYPFNRGPGVYEMLLFHDRAERGDVPPGG